MWKPQSRTLQKPTAQFNNTQHTAHMLHTCSVFVTALLQKLPIIQFVHNRGHLIMLFCCTELYAY